jgi:hypothetical protein
MIENAEDIRAAVKERFAQVARSPEQEQKFPVGPASAKKLGYGPQEIDSLPPSVTESFCGVGYSTLPATPSYAPGTNSTAMNEGLPENGDSSFVARCGENPKRR